MGRLPKEIPFRGDERFTRKVIEIPSGNSNIVVLTNGIETKVASQDAITWGGDFAIYVQFQATHGHWPTAKEQVSLHEGVRRSAFNTATLLPESLPTRRTSQN